MNKKCLFNRMILGIIVLLSLRAHGGEKGNDLWDITQNIPQARSDIEIVRKRLTDDLLTPAVNEEEVNLLTKTLQPGGYWPNINYEDVSRTGFEHSVHLQNMLTLARAYRKPSSPLYNNPTIKKAVSSALDFWINHDFICDNWWWNEMGTPNYMIDLLLILDEDLTLRQKTEGMAIASRANMEGVGARPGGDLIQIAGMMGKQALFSRNRPFLEDVLGIIASEVKITTGRGLKPDMSFHHRTDNVISTLGYGSGYINSFSYWALLIKDTRFILPNDAVELLIDYFLDGIAKSMVYGKYPDPGAKNRGMTRRNALAPSSPKLAEDLLKVSDYRKRELEEIIKIRKGEIQPQLRSNSFFWHSEYFTHQRPDYFVSVRMHSSRNRTMEEPHNDEGLKMHHFGDGSNFLSVTGREFVDIYPVWDWQKLPGTTILQKPALPHWREIAKPGLTDFVGGVSDGEYGAAAFDFISVHDPLSAKKSWFFFEDEYVCLGTGIHTDSDLNVVTTLDQSLLGKLVKIKKDGRPAETISQGNHQLGNVSWITHDKVAYLFPTPANIHLTNDKATGSWREINHQAWATAEPVEKEVFKLWIDHGSKPQNASYAYIVVPNLESPEPYLKKGQIEILANSPEIQAVKHKGLNISQIMFYEAGELAINDELRLGVDRPCIVMIYAQGKQIDKIAVSDPNRSLNAVQLTVNTKVRDAGDKWKTRWQGEEQLSLIQINLPQDGHAGKSVVLDTR